MIIVDRAIQQRLDANQPIRIGIVGAGCSARHIAAQILSAFPVIHLAVIVNRTPEHAQRALENAGAAEIRSVDDVSGLNKAIERGAHAITDNPQVLFDCERIDAVIETTGEVEYGAWVALQTIRAGKHLIALNCEMDATGGPWLKALADEQGVIYTNTDGDEPGVAANLARCVKTIGLDVVGAGNLKGFYDPYRTPETQAEFARQHNQKPRAVTSFVDGTKLSMELTVLANGLGFGVGKRGMFGPSCDDVRHCLPAFPESAFTPERGIVDYLVGAAPHTGAFVIGHSEQPMKAEYLRYLKMGDGPFYVFHTPYHLPQLEVPITVCRAVLLDDTTIAPLGPPCCDAITIAKRDLKAGETLDGIGGFTAYTLIDNMQTSLAENLLPMGVSDGCVLRRDISKDSPITYDDVELPKARRIDEWRRAMITRFFPEAAT